MLRFSHLIRNLQQNFRRSFEMLIMMGYEEISIELLPLTL